jgi:hypothetical protein
VRPSYGVAGGHAGGSLARATQASSPTGPNRIRKRRSLQLTVFSNALHNGTS